MPLKYAEDLEHIYGAFSNSPIVIVLLRDRNLLG